MGTLNDLGFPVGSAVVHGGAAGAGLGPVSGIDVGDSLITVRHITADLVTNADVTAEASITDADEITLTTTITTGNFVLVVWRENE